MLYMAQVCQTHCFFLKKKRENTNNYILFFLKKKASPAVTKIYTLTHFHPPFKIRTQPAKKEPATMVHPAQIAALT